MKRTFIFDLLIKISKPFYNKNLSRFKIFKYTYKLFYKIYSAMNVKKLIHVNLGKIKYKILVRSGEGNVEKNLIFKGIFQKTQTKNFIKHVKKEDIVLDIGANIGYFTLLFSKLVANEGKVLAFEPVNITYTRLKENLKLNQIKNVNTYKLGLGNRKETLEIYVNKKKLGSSSYIKNDKKSKKEFSRIIKFDEEFKNIKKVNFIKIDVEGFEFEAIKGMNKIIIKNKPKIALEYSPRFYENFTDNIEKYCLNFLKYFTNLNYKIYIMENTGELKLIKDINKFVKISNSIKSKGLYDLLMLQKPQ